MENIPLVQQIATMRQSFFDEELLDSTQFTQLELLEDAGNTNFVEDVFRLYLGDSTRLLATIEKEIYREDVPVNFAMVDRNLHQLKGSSASIGANKVRIEVIKTKEACQEGNVEGAKAAFQELRREYDTIEAKLKAYFELKKRGNRAGSAA
ncbi:hypothetical protein PTKIN_Ptkin03bG0242400 [Pterospermum kingtungense]